MVVAAPSARALMVVVMAAVVAVVMTLVSPVYAASGTASFYGPPYVPSACYGNQDRGVMVAAASDAIWNNGRVCGRRYRVRCTGATNQGPRSCKPNTYVDVTITDYCPPQGCHATIDLSRAAFDRIAYLDAGIVRIEYTRI